MPKVAIVANLAYVYSDYGFQSDHESEKSAPFARYSDRNSPKLEPSLNVT